jgi:hypothetical protein
VSRSAAIASLRQLKEANDLSFVLVFRLGSLGQLGDPDEGDFAQKAVHLIA